DDEPTEIEPEHDSCLLVEDSPHNGFPYDELDAYPIDQNYAGPLSSDTERSIQTKWRHLLGDDVDIIVSRSPRGHGWSSCNVDAYPIDQNYAGPLSSDTERSIQTKWRHLLGDDVDIIDPMNPNETVIVIRSLVPGGVAQLDARLIPGDRLLSVNETDLNNASLDQAVQVNEHRLLGMNHIAVVTILKELPVNVRMVCARSERERTGLINTSQDKAAFAARGRNIYEIDGRLHEGDQILAIDGQPLDGVISDQQAISILQQARGRVQIVVARIEEPLPLPSPTNLSVKSNDSCEMVLNTEWAQVESIHLVNDGSGLGFGIIGGRSTGVVVKTILPGGVADRDGHLQSGDHILQIGAVNLRGMGSEQVASVLRQSGSHVRLVSDHILQVKDGRLHEGDQILAIDGQPLDGVISDQQAISILQQARGRVQIVVARIEEPLPLPSPTNLSVKSNDSCEMVVNEHRLLGMNHIAVVTILKELPSLQVNEHRLLGMNHIAVVTILKELPVNVRMVCARSERERTGLINTSQDKAAFAARNILGGSLQNLMPAMERLVKAKSDGSLASSSGTQAASSPLSKLKSRSLEPLTGLAMWSSEPQIIELTKGDRGLGFSILDYQDPMNPNETVIVIRSLVPGGVAQLDARLIPGDRLLSVNETDLNNASLDQAVQALKGAPRGIVKIGVAKPLPIPDSSCSQVSHAGPGLGANGLGAAPGLGSNGLGSGLGSNGLGSGLGSGPGEYYNDTEEQEDTEHTSSENLHKSDSF
ncbi:patj homolog, partial [Diaphorina citri]|uniref:Patj homolog n=1 Tax=Diaphorina citri TaxID=121845 RepID=A0A3Q0JD32_DIACI